MKNNWTILFLTVIITACSNTRQDRSSDYPDEFDNTYSTNSGTADENKENEGNGDPINLNNQTKVDQGDSVSLGDGSKISKDDWGSLMESIKIRFCPEENCYCKVNGSASLQYMLHDDYTVCLGTKAFSGYSPYDIPFAGQVGGQIKELYVNDKKVDIRNRKDLYFRQKIKLAKGYNRVPVKIVVSKGGSSDYYIEITIEDIPEVIEIK